MVTVRADAKFCSTRCRVANSRKKKRESDTFPTEMTSKRRFLRWKLVRRNGRTTKVPVAANGGVGSSTDSSTWTDYDSAVASHIGAGVGFSLGEGIGCIDLDGAIVDGVVQPWAQTVLDQNPNTFVEISQSGAGLHIFGLLAEQRGRVIRDGRNIEVYSVGRFIALTGRRFGATPSRLAPLVLPV